MAGINPKRICLQNWLEDLAVLYILMLMNSDQVLKTSVQSNSFKKSIFNIRVHFCLMYVLYVTTEVLYGQAIPDVIANSITITLTKRYVSSTSTGRHLWAGVNVEDSCTNVHLKYAAIVVISSPGSLYLQRPLLLNCPIVARRNRNVSINRYKSCHICHKDCVSYVSGVFFWFLYYNKKNYGLSFQIIFYRCQQVISKLNHC